MNKVLGRAMFTVMASCAAGAAPALAQDVAPGGDERRNPGTVYLGVRAGAGSSLASNLKTISPRVDAITGQHRSSTVPVASAAIGLAPRSAPLRFELEASWRGVARHRVDAVGTCTVALCGQNFDFRGEQTARVRTAALMASAYYDHPLGGGFGLFAGGGVGVARLRSSAIQRFDIVQAPQAGTQTGAIWPKRSRTRFAYSFAGGLEKQVGGATVELGARYVGMGRYDTGYNVNLFSDERFSARLASVEGFLGFRLGL